MNYHSSIFGLCKYSQPPLGELHIILSSRMKQNHFNFVYFAIVVFNYVTLLWLPKYISINNWILSKNCFSSFSLIPNAVIYMCPLRSSDNSLALKSMNNITSAKDPCVAACINVSGFELSKDLYFTQKKSSCFLVRPQNSRKWNEKWPRIRFTYSSGYIYLPSIYRNTMAPLMCHLWTTLFYSAQGHDPTPMAPTPYSCRYVITEISWYISAIPPLSCLLHSGRFENISWLFENGIQIHRIPASISNFTIRT